MFRITRIAVPILAVGALVALLVGTQGAQDARATDLTREELVGLYQALSGAQYQPPACVPGEERFTDVPASRDRKSVV